MYFVSST